MLALVQMRRGPAAGEEKDGGLVGGSLWAPYRDDATRGQKLFDCARGVYESAWYKFRRFETLGLLNLYHYQDQLVRLEKDITRRRGEMAPKEVAELAILLREYCSFPYPD